jgi:hypothetical protein
MQDDDRGGKKDGERRLDKAVLLNLLSKVDSCGRSTDGLPSGRRVDCPSLGRPSAPRQSARTAGPRNKVTIVTVAARPRSKFSGFYEV